MAKITKVPDGPLVKKKGPFKGSTLKAGGKIKKAQDGTMKKSWNQMSPTERAATQTEIKATRGREGFSKYMDSVRTDQFAKGAERRGITVEQYAKKVKSDDKVKFAEVPGGCGFGKERTGCARSAGQRERWLKQERNRKNGGPVKKAKAGTKVKKAFLGSSMFKDNPIYEKTTALRGKLGSAALGIPGVKPVVKNGGMLKRADGSTSQRGLWDNIRANKASGKKPTAAMLKQEKKIKAKK